MMAVDIPESVYSLFVMAGWHADRRVALGIAFHQAVAAEHPATAILTCLAGLHVGTVGRGVECATSDIQFAWFGIPRYTEAIAPWEHALGTQLVAIAEFHNKHSRLYVADDGRCFSLSLGDDDFFLRASRCLLRLNGFFVGYARVAYC